MGDMLSQAEIDALLGGGGSSSTASDDRNNAVLNEVIDEEDIDNSLSSEQKDILGEIGNISMGTAATTLFALLNQKVWITTPKVTVMTWKKLSSGYERPCVGIRVDYKEGLRGSNVLILRQDDVKIITNLMMGGDGNADLSAELTELDLSAIGEAMNQMVGSSSTSISSMIKEKIDIDTPKAFILNFENDTFFDSIGFAPEEVIACISFRMEIGTLIDSDIMQILPRDFAVSMVEKLRADMMGTTEPVAPTPPAPPPAPSPAAPYTPPPAPAAPPPMPSAPDMGFPQQPYQQPPQQQPYPYPPYSQQPYPYPPYQQEMYAQPPIPPQSAPQQPMQNVNVQPVQFQSFDVGSVMQQKENIGIIMDVPLDVTVELGRTRKKIKEILEFAPGSIIELDKLAGEPIDILVNGKFVAKGEVVVIDENFGIRITDIISVEDRI